MMSTYNSIGSFRISTLLLILIATSISILGCAAESIESTGSEAMERGVRDALSRSDPLDRTTLLANLLQQLTSENLRGALDAYETSALGVGDGEIGLFVYAWSRFDPEAALSRAIGWTRTRQKSGVNAALFTWAQRDPGAVRDAIASFQDPVLVDLGLGSLVNGWALSKVPGVDDFVASMPKGPNRERLQAAMIARWVQSRGPEAVMRWVESLPDEPNGRFKRTAFRQVAGQVANTEPRRAAAWVLNSRAMNDTEAALARVLTRWMQWGDVQAAFDWLASLPESTERDAILSEAYRRWVGRDRPSAMAALPRIENLEPAFDPAVDLFARTLASKDPAEAIKWAQKIQDTARRTACLIEVAQVWHRSDGAQVEAWMATSELDHDAQQTVLAAGSKRSRRP